jgi:hypothetical protein
MPPSTNPQNKPCGDGQEVGLGRFFTVKQRSPLQLRGVACNARVRFDVRVDYAPTFQKDLPSASGSNEALLDLSALPVGQHVIDWQYDSPVPIAKWQTTTELIADEAVLFRFHKRADSNFPRDYGVLVVEVVP